MEGEIEGGMLFWANARYRMMLIHATSLLYPMHSKCFFTV